MTLKIAKAALMGAMLVVSLTVFGDVILG